MNSPTDCLSFIIIYSSQCRESETNKGDTSSRWVQVQVRQDFAKVLCQIDHRVHSIIVDNEQIAKC